MKIFISCLLLALSTIVQAKLLTWQEFQTFEMNEQTQVLEAYREFLRAQTDTLDSETLTKISWFVEEAYATSHYNCFFAGWPSVKRTVMRNGERKSVCTSPARGNDSYRSLASGCGAQNGYLLCQPALFGPDLCVKASTPAEKNLAFTNCEKKFQSEGKDLHSVAAALSDPALSTAGDELFHLVDEVCTRGFQSQNAMCRKLKARVESIKHQRPAVRTLPAGSREPQTGSSGVADVPRTNRASTQSSAPANTELAPVAPQRRGTQGELRRTMATVAAGTAAVASAGKVDCPPSEQNQNRVNPAPTNVGNGICPAPEAEAGGENKTLQDYTAELERLGVEVVTRGRNGQTLGIQNIGNLQRFLVELHKYPEPLLLRLKQLGGRIRIWEGTDVLDDPTFDPSTPVYGAGRVNWSTIPGSGGDVAGGIAPTRIVINHLRDHQGSANLLLHEHGHMLDSSHAGGRFSDSPEWMNLINSEPNYDTVIQRVCADNYCARSTEHGPREAFAELFDYYYACPGSRAILEANLPNIAAFFRNIQNNFPQRQP